MKKIFLALGLTASLAVSAFAQEGILDQLNTEVVSILARFQNEATAAKLVFTAAETDATHALKIALNGLYRKTGSQNVLELAIDNLSYEYGDGTAPTTIARGSLGLDMTKIMPQDQINEMIPQAAQIVEEMAKSFARDYGDAAKVKGVVTSTTKDADGNYVGLTALLTAKFDLTKLPEGKKSEDIIATEAVASISLNVKKGVSLDAFVVSNPEYKGFRSDQEGLKEMIDKLLSRDDATMAKIAKLAEQLDGMAAGIVEKQ